ncbi:hypothetical protein [Aliarcobacter butzleri]|uniref:hypothetical protein n=1 Tax=Aliarcobacter butzleri TaxID=28197 RepID=UPI001269F927|nr:hypothetical protein [Aliarcobacter butzleri]
MNYLYIIEKTRKVSPIIKKYEAIESDKDSSIKRYKDETGKIQYVTKNKFCYETEHEAINKIKELTDKTDKEIEVIEIRPILAFEKELNENDLYISKEGDEYELYIGTVDKSIVFSVDCESSEELQEVLIKECKHHLEMIETKDKDYFDDCDAEYLKGDWKKLVQKILEIVQE